MFHEIIQRLRENNPEFSTAHFCGSFTTENAHTLRAVLQTNTTLRRLLFSWNNLSPETIIILTDILRTNFYIQDFQINDSKLTLSEMAAIAHAVSDHPTLEILRFANNHLDDVSIEPLIAVAKNSRVLKSIYVVDNSISPHYLEILSSGLRKSHFSCGVDR